MTYTFYGKEVSLVMGADKPTTVRVQVGDNRAAFGQDAPKGVLMVHGSRLYKLVKLDKAERVKVTLTFDSGVEANACTFG